MSEKKKILKDSDSEKVEELERDEEEVDREERRKKKRRKSLLKLNLVSLFFTAVSFISVTLAWFAYSGLVTTYTEVDVKSWYIEFNKKGKAVSNNIVINLDDIYPGMDIMSEVIDIKNGGDSAAMIDYKIKSVRILNETIEPDNTGKLEDELSHKYPFRINMALSNTYANAINGKGKFIVSVSWPLDPLDTEDSNADSVWGAKAYQFQQAEALAASKDSNYQARSSVEIVLSLEAVQYVGEGNAPDSRYPLGKIMFYDPVLNEPCEAVEGNCLKTYVIDENNKMSDGSVTLMPDLSGNYLNSKDGINYLGFDTLYTSYTTGWTSTHRSMKVTDLINIVSDDVVSSMMVGTDISSRLIGFVDYGNRIEKVIESAKQNNAYFRFKNETYPYLVASSCYWLEDEYDVNRHFAFTKADESYSKIYPENKTNSCRVVPLIEVSKNNLNKAVE